MILADQYINNSGIILPKEGHNLNIDNRAYRYGDGLFESIRVVNGKIVGLQAHLDRLFSGLKELKIEKPVDFSFSFFNQRIEELIEKNGIEKGGRVRLTVSRENGGFYRPQANGACFTIEADAYDDNLFVLNQNGLSVDLYPENRKPISSLSKYKNSNALLYIMAALYAEENGFDDVILQNNKFEIIEGTSSNLFIVSNGVLYTPGLDSGCVGGTMRMQIINLAIKHSIRVYESNIAPSSLLAADELFFTNSISGIRWVSSYKNKRYFNNTSVKLVDLLNRELIN